MEIEQAALDTLNTKAGQVDTLTTEVTTLKGQIESHAAVITERDELKTASGEHTAKLVEVEGKLTTATAEITNLKATAEVSSGQATDLTAANVKVTELTAANTALNDKIITSIKDRLKAQGLTDEHLKDKDMGVLEAMEVAGNAVRTTQGAVTTKEAGLGGSGSATANQSKTHLEQADAEMAALRSNTSKHGTSDGSTE